MKKLIQLFILLIFVISAQSQVSRTINLSTSGTLDTFINSSEKKTITNLTITGSIDARDFKIMRDSMPLLETLNIKDANIQSYNGNAGTGSKSTLYTVNEIPQFAFCNPNIQLFNKTLKSIIFPTTATSIGTGAFSFCQSLQVVNIPKNILKITQMAFVASNATFSVDPDNPNYSDLEGSLFNKTKNVLIQCPVPTSSSYIIPTSVDSVGSYAFYNCTNITSVNIPSQVKYIGSYAFGNCTGLLSITTNSSAEKIQLADNVFSNVKVSDCILNVPFATKSLYRLVVQWSAFTNITENIHGFKLNKTSLVIPSTGGLINAVSIESNESWNISSNQNWVQVSKANGIGNDTIEFVIDSNTSTETRMAVATITGVGVEPQTITINQAGQPKVVNLTAGNLSTTLTQNEMSNIINLKLSGTIDARDFKIMRDQMPLLSGLDMSDLTIVAYTGTEGTESTSNNLYAANKIPQYAFCPRGVYKENDILQSIILPTSSTVIGSYAFASCSGLHSIKIPDQLTSIENYAFYKCKGLKAIILPNALVKIENSVFSYSGLETITIPNSVITIDSNAFGNCISLNSASISNSVTTIGTSAFQYCNALTNLVIGNAVTSLGNCAFQYCTSLTNVVIPNSVKVLNGYVFGYCSNLTNATLSNSLTSIGYATFQNCTKLKSIVIPASVMNIEHNAFGHCQSLTEINIPTSVKDIQSNAFEYCTELIEIMIPNSVTTLGSRSFYNCTGLTKVTLPNSLTSVDSYAFYNCTSLKTITIPNSITKIGTNSFQSCTGLLKVRLGNKIVSIGSYAFGSCSSLTDLIIPKSVTSIGSSAFENCNQLTSVYSMTTSPVNLSSSTDVFKNVNKTTCVLNVPNGVKSLYVLANQWKDFQNIVECPYALQVDTNEVKLSSNQSRGVVKVSSNTTWSVNCDTTWLSVSPAIGFNNDSIVIIANSNPTYYTRNAVITVFVSGFAAQKIYVTQSAMPITVQVNAGELYSTLTPNRLNTIESLVVTGTLDARDFKTMRDYMPLLSSVDLTNVNIIEYTGKEGTFLSETLTYPANQIPAFSFCRVYYEYNQLAGWIGKTTLKVFKLPESIESIGTYAFYRCAGIVGELNISDKITSIEDDAFGFCSGLTTVKFGLNVSKIGDYAFYACSNLKGKVYFMNNIKTIGKYAFMSCYRLTEIYIGNNVTSLGSSAFGGCNGLVSIYAYSPKPIELNYWEVFSGVSRNSCIIYVPAGSKSAYQSASWWSEFRNIVEMTTGLNNEKVLSIKLYPNPITSGFRITGLTEIGELTLIDMNGKVLLTKIIENEEYISINNLSKGIYFVRIISKNATSEQKILVE